MDQSRGVWEVVREMAAAGGDVGVHIISYRCHLRFSDIWGEGWWPERAAFRAGSAVWSKFTQSQRQSALWKQVAGLLEQRPSRRHVRELMELLAGIPGRGRYSWENP